MTTRRPRRRSAGGKWILLLLVVLGAVFVSGLFAKRARKPAYPPTAFFEVKRGDMLISITEEGALRALNETVVRSALEGFNRVIHLVPEGTHVKKGELIVELDSAGLKDRLNEEELAYQERLFQLLQAQGNLRILKSLAESEIKDAELKVENAQSDLEKYRDGDAPLLIKTIESRSSVLAEQVRISKERLARTQDLFQKGNATRSELQADELSLRREQLALSQYEEDLRLVKKYDQPNQVRLLQSKVEQAGEELERLRQRTTNEIAQAEADLKTSERSVAILEESIKMQKRRLENAKIFAPQDGLVVYASVSPFQSMGGGGEMRRDEGRFRGSGGSGGRGFGGTSGEFRGGRRGGRLSSESSGLSASSSSSSGNASTAQSVSAANQRIASAISGSAATQPSTAGGAAGGAGGSVASGGGGGRGAGGTGGSGGGQGTASASSSFAQYPSMRPSSSIPTTGGNSGAAGSAGGASGSGSGASGSSSSSSGGGQSTSLGNSQFGYRSQSSQNFPSYEFFGTPGVLEEGIMVRQRQELIRLPDVSKMLAEIKIHESRVRQVRPGMTAYVRIENIPGRRFKGTVRRVAPLPDAQMSWLNPDMKVHATDILIEEELPDLKPGVSARAEVVITNLTQVLSVPIQTVARHRGENVCFVQRGSGVVPAPVTTGWFNDRFIQVTAGLKEGDRVLLAPVSDEGIEAAPAETNEVESAEQATPPAVEPAPEEAPRGERRMQRRNFEGPNADAQPSEGRGERPARQGGRGRRSQPTQEAPE
jgi:multidrug resistance efflux pump